MRHTDNDNYLLSALQKGGSAAFDSIFRKYYPILCAYASRFVTREEAEDIAEDTLLWLWEHKDYLEIDASLGAYLIRAVYHKAMNRIRQEELKKQSRHAVLRRNAENDERRQLHAIQRTERPHQGSYPIATGLLSGGLHHAPFQEDDLQGNCRNATGIAQNRRLPHTKSSEHPAHPAYRLSARTVIPERLGRIEEGTIRQATAILPSPLAAFLLISFHFFTKNTYLYGQKKQWEMINGKW